MQNTRLTSLIGSGIEQFDRWLENPWRRISLIIIGFLFGFFLANLVASIAGQTGDIDAIFSLILLIFVELVNWLVYGGNRQRNRKADQLINQQEPNATELRESRSLSVEVLNAVKLGLIYSLFLEAFKLGS